MYFNNKNFEREERFTCFDYCREGIPHVRAFVPNKLMRKKDLRIIQLEVVRVACEICVNVSVAN